MVKRIILLLDAAADFPFEELGNRTPLQLARMPTARQWAEQGCGGVLRLQHSSTDASRALLGECCGFPQLKAQSIKWGPVAARGLGLSPQSSRTRMLCQFVTYNEQDERFPERPSSDEEQEQLLSDLEGALRDYSGKDVKLHSLQRGRFVLDWPEQIEIPEREKTGWRRSLRPTKFPVELKNLLQHAEEVLEAHSINIVRLDLGENPLQGIWVWSGGSGDMFPDQLGFSQALCSPDPLVKGLASMLGLPFVSMKEPYLQKDEFAAMDLSRVHDVLRSSEELVFWIPAPYSTSPFQDAEQKVRMLDAVDFRVLTPLAELADRMGSLRILLMSAGLRHRGRPEKGLLPFLLWGEGVEADSQKAWNEADSREGGLGQLRLPALLERFRE